MDQHDDDHLQFPSGRTVGNCRKDAKRLVRQDGRFEACSSSRRGSQAERCHETVAPRHRRNALGENTHG